MARWDCFVATSWVADSNGANVPALLALLAAGDNAQDATGQPDQNIVPSPNAVVWRVTCSAATLDAIAADAGHVVMTSEELADANA